MQQLALRTRCNLAQAPFIWAKCDYCDRVASLRVLGDSVVCDRCLGVVEDVPMDELTARLERDA